MQDVPDIYADQFNFRIGPYGVVLNMELSSPETSSNRQTPQTVTRIRVSHELLKVMVFMLWRGIRSTEKELGVSFPISNQVLNAHKIAPEDWNAYWASIPEIK